jgi:hypothetical protein
MKSGLRVYDERIAYNLYGVCELRDSPVGHRIEWNIPSNPIQSSLI